MKPRIINGCGYNLSGCTAITDFFSDYQGAGYINHKRHEIGILKCRFGFAGSIQSIIRGQDFRATAEQLRASLLGELQPLKPHGFGPIEVVHLEMRERVKNQLGEGYTELVDGIIHSFPEDISSLSPETALGHYENALKTWLHGAIDLLPDQHFLDGTRTDNSFIMLKNDPPGKYPYMASLIPNGVTFSSLRDPMDACFDFNRFYDRGFAEAQIVEYCEMFNSIVRTAMHHIEQYRSKIAGTYYVIKFEDFIKNEAIRAQALGIAGICQTRKRQLFEPQKSVENIGIGESLSSDLQHVVTKLSYPWYHKYVDFLTKENLLLSV